MLRRFARHLSAAAEVKTNEANRGVVASTVHRPFWPLCEHGFGVAWFQVGVSRSGIGDCRVDGVGPGLSLFRHVATGDQYWDDDCDIFLMVFLIQNTQNRNARVINLKLGELICAISSAETR